MASENIVALCDVNETNLAAAAKQFPKAKTYDDWRKCLDQKDIDAVVCSTTDHTHAFVNVWAMNRGKHVYCEKPLANSVHEARTVRETYLKNKGKLATQMGTQIHATRQLPARRGAGQGRRDRPAPRRSTSGAAAPPRAAATCREGGRPGGAQLGPLDRPVAATTPSTRATSGGCLAWNRFWDFGSGQIGDMGSHMIDLAYWALDLRFPTSCEATGHAGQHRTPARSG